MVIQPQALGESLNAINGGGRVLGEQRAQKHREGRDLGDAEDKNK